MLTARLSNPLGGTIPEERQRQLLRLAGDYDFQIVEDDIYGELMFEQGPTKALKSHDRDSRVIYCSSFSKTPVARCAHRLDRRRQVSGRDPSGCRPSPPIRRAASPRWRWRPIWRTVGMTAICRHIRQEYRKNLNAFQLAVQQYFPVGTQMTRPKGGFILWVSLPARVNTKDLHVRALQQGISIAPGLIFSNTEQFNHCVRLNCGIPVEPRGREGADDSGHVGHAVVPGGGRFLGRLKSRALG